MQNKVKRYPGESKWKGLLYLLPALLLYLIFTFLPILETIRSSFFQAESLYGARSFVWFQNYIKLFQDSQFLSALRNNFVFIFFYSFLPISFGLFLASFLARVRVPGMRLFRTLYFIPQVLSMVVVGVMWRWMYDPNIGPINVFLRWLGLDQFAQAWLGSFTFALPAVGMAAAWVQYGFCMVLFLSGIQRIPEELYEATSLDGANAFRQFWHVTLPGLMPELSVALMTTIIAALRVFDLVFAMTKGAPGGSTEVTGLLIYRWAFELNNHSYAATMATVLTLIILLISLVIRRVFKQSEKGAL